MKKWRRWLWMTGVATSLATGAALQAQTPNRPPSNPVMSAKTAAPQKARADDSGRLMEVLVELAWLADPVTFPYYLEARVDGQALEVRGYVPSKAIRDKAINL